MRIKKLSLRNFRNYSELKINFSDSNFVVFVGPNGSGKTSILDAIAYCLAHQSGQLSSDRDDYSIECSLKKIDIKNGEKSAIVKSDLLIENKDIIISESKSIDENGVSYDVIPKDYFSEVRKYLLVNPLDVKLPLLIYYRANRTSQINNTNVKSHTYYNKRLSGYQFSFSESNSAFNLFENWYLNLENIENEQKIKNKDFNYEIQGLKLIRFAIVEFLKRINNANYSNLRGERMIDKNIQFHTESTGNGYLTITKGDTPLRLSQLSMGEKMVLYIVSDIARRLVILNDFDNLSLHQSGIVLIDELELHLHPEWQRSIVNALKKTFPGLQFISTTHSPQILSNLTDNEILILEKEKYYNPSTNPLGRDTNGILEEVFDVSDRPTEVKILIDRIFELIATKEINLNEIYSKLSSLKNIIAKDDPIIIRIENVLDRIKLTTH